MPIEMDERPSDRARRACVQAVLLALVVAVALTLRLGPEIRSPESEHNGHGPFGDTQLYHRIAVNLLRGNGYSSTDDGSAHGTAPVEVERYDPAITRPPAYPFFMAAVYACVGERMDARPEIWRSRWHILRLVQGLLDASVCVLVFFLARALAPALAWAPLMAAAIYAVSPYNVFYARALLSECLTSFLLTAGLLACVHAARRSARLGWLATGVLLGLAVLANPQLVLFPVLLGAWLFLRSAGGCRDRLRAPLLCLAGTALAVAPWLARNALVFHRPATISLSPLWSSVFFKTFESKDTWCGFSTPPESVFPDPEERAAIKARMDSIFWFLNRGTVELAEADREFRPLVLQRIREHPGRTLASWIEGVPRLWYQDYIQMYRDREATGVFVLVYLALALYAAGRASPPERAAMAPVGLLAVYVTLVFLPLHIEPRYSVTAMPGLIAVAGSGLARAIADASGRWRARV